MQRCTCRWPRHNTVSLFPRWLCNDALPPTSRRWAIEGLAYLTLDADVKEDLVEDKKALQAMFELAKVLVQRYGQWFRYGQSITIILIDLYSPKTKRCCLLLDQRWSTALTAMTLRSQTLRWWNLRNMQNSTYLKSIRR